MSMHNYAEYGMGLVLTSSKKIGDVDEIEYLCNAFGVEDAYELVDLKSDDRNNTWRYYDDEMEGKCFIPFDNDVVNFDEYPSEMFVIWASRMMQPFEVAYSSPEELRQEFINILGDILPKDFDWNAHIGEFSCSIYC